MKTKILKGWKWMVSVGSTMVFLGCINETNGINAQNSNETNVLDPAIVSNNAVPVEAPPDQAVIAPANLSPGIPEVIELAQSGVSEEVLLAYVARSGRSFNPSVDEIVYLKDLGIPESVVAALVSQAETTNEVAVAGVESAPAETNFPDPSQVSSNVPSLTEPPVPSYSVTAESATVAAPPAQDIDINYFETTLSPYGSWIDVPDYGRCWQPTVVVINRDWRPYSDRGRWLYTSSGWYWQSDYSWGWAPFHYGRWHDDHRYGWVWVPGSTWAPSWVSWRYTDQYYGWAPLPPAAHYRSGVGFYYRNSHVGINFDFGLRDDCYTFIPTSRFCDPRPYRYYAPRSHSKTIYRNSVVINNYIRGDNNTIINEGIGRDRISRETRTPIRTVALRDLPTTTTPVGKADRFAQDGKSLAVFRPDAQAQRSLSRSIRQASAQNSPTSTSPERSSLAGVNSVSRQIPSSRIETPNSRATALTQDSSAAATASRTTTFPRTWSRSDSRQVPTTERSVSPGVTAPNSSQTQNPAPVATTQSGNGSLRQLPTASTRSSTSGQGQDWQSRSSVATTSPNTRSIVTPRNVPSPVAPSTISRERQVVPVAPSRTLPSASPSRSIPSWRDARNSGSIGQNIPAPSQQRSIRSVSPSPVPTAPPARAQQPTFSPPPQSSRDNGRIERSMPARSQPAARVETPRSAPAPRAQSAQPSRSGGGRSIRDRN